MLEASNEAVLVAGKEPTVERHEEANEQEPVENAPGTEHRQEHVIQLTDQQQGADSRHAAPDIKTSQEAANQEPAEEDSSIFVREVKAQQAPVIVDKQQPVVKLADKQQGADPVEEAPTIELSKKVENDAVQGRYNAVLINQIVLPMSVGSTGGQQTIRACRKTLTLEK